MFHALPRLICRCSIALYLTPALGVSVFAAATSGHEFSADIVTRDAAGAIVGSGAKLYVADRKVRIETPDADAGFFLTDGETDTSLFVRPARRDFMDAKQSSRLTAIFVSVESGEPCRQWRAAEMSAGARESAGDWHCGRADGLSAAAEGSLHYRVIAADQNTSDRWVDPTLKFPVKLQAADGTTIALEHICVESQPAGLFVVPPGYRKFDPHELLERIKHSDVWVDSPR